MRKPLKRSRFTCSSLLGVTCHASLPLRSSEFAVWVSELDIFIKQLRTAGIPYFQAVQAFRKQFIWTLLARHHGNQCKVAKKLGVHRNTVKHMLDELGIDPNEIRALNGELP